MLHQEQSSLSFENQGLPILKLDTEDVTPEERCRSLEECLSPLDKDALESGIITYTEMFNTLPLETQDDIRRFYKEEINRTGKCDIGHLIRFGYNKSLQNKKDGIAEPPTLPSGEVFWKRTKPASSNFTATRH